MNTAINDDGDVTDYDVDDNNDDEGDVKVTMIMTGIKCLHKATGNF